MKLKKLSVCTDPRCLDKDGKPRVFAKSALLRQHVLKVHAAKNLKLNCQTCGAKFLHQSSLQRHLKSANHVKQITSQKNVPAPVLRILPVQLIPVLVAATPQTHQNRFILPKSVQKSDSSCQTESLGSSKSTTTDDLLTARPGPSIATQTKTAAQCTVAVGIDKVFEDLEKLFSQAETQTHERTEFNFQHAETQTQKPCLADSDIQTTLDHFSDFLPIPPDSFQTNDVQVERIFGDMEVQTTSFEPQMQHFGMQTTPLFGTDSKIAGTQTSGGQFDGQSQTGLESLSVETQTIEQFLSSLES